MSAAKSGLGIPAKPGLKLCFTTTTSPDDIVDLFSDSIAAMAAVEPNGALTDVIVREKATRALRHASEQAALVLARGDETELASLLLEDLQGSGEVIFDLNQFHQYRADQGIWVALSEAELSRRVQDFAGRPVQRGNATAPLRIDARTVGGAIRLAQHRVTRDRFFAQASAGVAFQNGYLQLTNRGVTLQPHSPEHRARARFDFDFDQNANMDEFDEFLWQVFGADPDGHDKRILFCEFLGACITGTATQRAKALVCRGDGRNGKSTLEKIIEKCIPDGAVSHVTPQQFEDEYYRAALDGMLLNTVAEMPKAEMLKTEAFKAIIAGDPISARAPTERPRTVYPRAGHIFAANTLPAVDDHSSAFWLRIIVVEFNASFAGRADETIADRIIAKEIPGIIAWAIYGLGQLLKRGTPGYTIPASHTLALSQWKQNADQVALFLQEMTSPAQEPRDRTPAKLLYEEYRKWAEANGHRPLANNNFGHRVKALSVRSVKPAAQTLYEVRVTGDEPVTRSRNRGDHPLLQIVPPIPG